ncbi:hypothetical protein Dimus_033271, partial [Dionaea muscipula]
RQKWENLFKRRELVHIDVVKEFYAKMIVIHLKKKDIVKSKEVWEESKYTKPLEITRRFANNESITAARRLKSGEPKPRQRFVHFLGSGENRRRDDDEAAPEEEAEGEDEGNQVDFDWEAVIDEATVEGESGSGEKFYDAEEDAQGSPELPDEIPADATPGLGSTEGQGHSRVDPRSH